MNHPLTKEQLERSIVFAPCSSKDHLQLWLRRFLKLDLPDCIVCDDDVRTEPSNTSPVDLIWEVYSAGMNGNDPNSTRFLAYASRDSWKTVVASVLEVLALFHMRRDVGHLGGILEQSEKCYEYIDRYLTHPLLKQFVTINRHRMIEITWWETADRKTFITPGEYDKAKKNDEKWIDILIRRCFTMKIHVASLTGTNSGHPSWLTIDELELVDRGPFNEAMMMPSMNEDRKLPIVFMTSSRKFAGGMVQDQIDEAPDTGTKVRHWNYIDVTESCPPERHQPDLPKVKIFFSEDNLRSIAETEFEGLTDKEKTRWHSLDGFQGCLTHCKMFAFCRGRLATKQKSKSKLLKNIHQTANQFKTFAKTVEVAKAQLLSWKPMSTGLVYPFLNKETHVKTASQIAEMITGNPHREDFSKEELVRLFQSLDAKISSGMDWGFTHNFAVVTGAIYGRFAFVFSVIEIAGLEVIEKLELCEKQLRPYNPVIYPDPEDPSSIKTFKKAGYTMVSFKKDVTLGVDSARSKIMPSTESEPELYFLAGDSGCEAAFNKISRHKWKMDAAGKPTDILNEEPEKDVSDAFRYWCQNEFGKHLGKSHKPPDPKTPKATPNPNQNWMAQEVNQQLQGEDGRGEGVSVKRGKFFFGG